MAAQNITLKRVINANGTTDDLFPTTHLGQIYIADAQGELTSETLNTYLGNTFINVNQLGANSGVATLNSGGKLTASQVPDYLLGGLKFVGGIGTGSPSSPLALKTLITGSPTAGYSISSNLDTFSSLDYASGDYGSNEGLKYVGHYWVMLNNGQLFDATTGTPEADWDTAVFDDGEAPATTGGGGQSYDNAILLEAGDWVIITAWNEATQTFKFRTINNTTQDASTAVKGLVTLTSAVDTAALTNGSNKVITENFISDNLYSGELSGDDFGFAAAIHIHDSRYYTETEVNNWVDGISTINSAGFTEIKYGSAPTGTVVGTLLIALD